MELALISARQVTVFFLLIMVEAGGTTAFFKSSCVHCRPMHDREFLYYGI